MILKLSIKMFQRIIVVLVVLVIIFSVCTLPLFQFQNIIVRGKEFVNSKKDIPICKRFEAQASNLSVQLFHLHRYIHIYTLL